MCERSITNADLGCKVTQMLFQLWVCQVDLEELSSSFDGILHEYQVL